MEHEERVQLGRDIAQKIVETHGNAIQVVAVYGSTAKDQDGPHSDLEMWVTTGEGGDAPDGEVIFVYRGITVEISYSPAQRFLKAARHVGPDWPIQADAYRHYIVLYSREGSGFVEELQQATLECDDTAFNKAIRERMAMAHESKGKLKNAWERKESQDVLLEGRWMAWNTTMVLGLVNRRYYNSGRGLYQMSKTMEVKPKDYERLVDLAGGFTTHDMEQVYWASLELWENLKQIVRAQGPDIAWESTEIMVGRSKARTIDDRR